MIFIHQNGIEKCPRYPNADSVLYKREYRFPHHNNSGTIVCSKIKQVAILL